MSELAPTWVAIVTALIGGGSLLAVFFRLTFGQRQQASTAFIEGHQKATEALRQEMSDLRVEFKAEFAASAARSEAEIAALREQVSRLHRALARLVPLVAPEHLDAAVAVLVELGISAIDPSVGGTTWKVEKA